MNESTFITEYDCMMNYFLFSSYLLLLLWNILLFHLHIFQESFHLNDNHQVFNAIIQYNEMT